ncbi:hypothetical protein Kpol_1054p58 [Vanderwaltozyma polyspora DSM 70294]|uniref:Glycosyltransferase HOC1 n=1 Tax=Vanderwaltozyma polyspora (strain ATCC 22028 / DSM 70294 / BCRC 21397 / CBS 2163 / NBRC 10782 / NRRL Y-8283 / UCD 57-17) TaxID=436907 RepID=A7TIE4_VANPO|nr:uncharacterized protein Kpol_1054p58 [Vanderwaltozyma polyspora DSM 70294]EDO18010.1 hypothetical protein Kpol_1054p58 [Vanderwaltozyma polyspora DSM 70294]
MAKTRRADPPIKTLSIVGTIVVISVIIIIKFISSSHSHDIENIIENLNKEINSNIDSVSRFKSRGKSDDKVLSRLEELISDVLTEQTRQADELVKQRKLLEKKVAELKQMPESGSLREKLAYTFEYNTARKFPAYIWQTHVKPNSKSAPKQRANKANRGNWENKNPSFVHELFEDMDVISAMVQYHYSSIPDVVEAYMSMKSDILKIDFFKYLILLARGGVYSDYDTDPIQPIPNWIPEFINPKDVGIIVGVEYDLSSGSLPKNYERRLQFATWVIQCKPGHPIIREIVAQITETTLQRKRDGELSVNTRDYKNIINWTGSGVWTDIIFSYFNNYLQSGLDKKVVWKDFHNLLVPKLMSDVLVLPKFSFNAPDNKLDGHPDRTYHYCTHDKKESWKKVPTL